MTKELFARRFSFSHWVDLCRDPKFAAAVESADYDLAECLVYAKLNEELNPPPPPHEAFLKIQKDRAQALADDAAQRKLVSDWASRTGRTGRHNKQSRQAHIRRLKKHGLNSDYAARMRAEAGL